MRPFKRRSALIILCIICIVTGAIFIGFGFAQGGNISYMSLNKKSTSWWPFKVNAGLVINGNNAGLIVVNDEDNSSEGQHEEKIDNIQDLTLDLDKVDAYVQVGDENKIIFENLDSDEWKLDTKNEEVKLKIDTNHLNLNAKIVIEVKQDEIKKLNVKLAFGNLEIHDQKLDVMDLDCDLGNISLYNTKANAANVSADAGNIEGDNVELQNAKLDVDAGNIIMQGKLAGKIEASSDAGNIELKINGNVSDYGYKISCTMGNVTFNGEGHIGSIDLESQTNAKNVLDIENDLGNIEVSFYD